MRAVNFNRGIIQPIAHLLGIDPALDLAKDHVAAWVSDVNTRVIEAWEFWDWPELEVAEERAFRTIWNATRQFQLDDELFYIPTFKYYKAIATPPLGTLPTDLAYFEEATITNRYIALDQTGKRPIDKAVGVYHGNPTDPCSMCGLGFAPSHNGIQLNGYGGPTAFLRYRITPPQFTDVAWNSTTLYQVNDKVYFNDDGDCYQAIHQNQNHSPSETAYWRKIEMPQFLAPFIQFQVASDMSDDAGAGQRWDAAAADVLVRKVNKLLEQGQTHQYRIRRNAGCRTQWPLGTTGFFWSASPPWTDITTTTLTDEDDPFSEETSTMLEDGLTPIPNGQSYVDVVLTPDIWPNANYQFDQLVIINNVDNPPINIDVSIITGQATTGFRAMLTAPPDNDHYSLKWRITS